MVTSSESSGTRASGTCTISTVNFATSGERGTLCKVVDENQIKETFINEGRGHSPSHLKFFLLVFSKLKEDIK